MVEAPKHTRLGDGPIQQDYREKMSAVMAALDRFMNGEAKAPPLSRWILTRTHLPSNRAQSWLPFSPLYEVVTSRGRRSGVVSREAVWRNTQPEQHEGTV